MGEIKISGLPEIQRKMQDVARKVRNRSARKAMNAGASTLKKEIKNRVPILKEEVPHRRKGTIKRNIRSKTKVRRNGQIKTRIWVKSLPGKKSLHSNKRQGKTLH